MQTAAVLTNGLSMLLGGDTFSIILICNGRSNIVQSVRTVHAKRKKRKIIIARENPDEVFVIC